MLSQALPDLLLVSAGGNQAPVATMCLVGSSGLVGGDQDFARDNISQACVDARYDYASAIVESRRLQHSPIEGDIRPTKYRRTLGL